MELETASLRCSSCGARCEPTRSFCKRCGSAVFVDDAVYSRLRQMPDLEHGGSQVGTASTSDQTATASGPRAVRRPAKRMAPRQVPAVAAGAGCVGSLIRWAVLVGIAYYALNAFGLWPGLKQAADGLLRGDQSGVNGFIEQLRGGTFSTPGTGTAADSPTPASASPDSALVTPPRVINRVAARYPAEAFARGLQGTVVLRVTVEPDGAVSNIEVVRSVDTQYGIDDAAVAAVRSWTFEPGRRGDERVRLATTVSVRFATAQTPAAAPAAP